jgi:Right handed beta helix region
VQTRVLAAVLALLPLACAPSDASSTATGDSDSSHASTGPSTGGDPSGDPSADPSGDPSAPEGSADGPPADASGPGDDTSGSESGEQPTVCEGDCHFVRAGASGSGGDWDDALPELPETLERGHVYFVASGSYPGYAFDDDAMGTATIRVLRASASDHGTDDGWDPSYADGLAELGPLVFSAPLVELDGRGATRVVGTFESTVVDIGASDVTVRGCDIDGNFQEDGGQQTDGACTGMSIVGDGVVVSGNVIHDAADDGVAISGSTGVSFAGNTIHALHGCGTDGGCGPCYNGHSDGLELYDLADSEIVGNLVYDVASTSTLFFGNWADELGMGASEYCENILIANNLLYAPDTGFVAYIEDARGVQIVSNVMWGLHQGAYGGLSIGMNVEGLEIYDNAILSINYEHIGGSYDAAEHHGDYNLFGVSLGQWVDGEHDIVAIDPGFTAVPGADDDPIDVPTPADFVPAGGSPLVDAGWGGDDAVMIPSEDFFGTARDDTPNIGAIE